MDFVNITLHIYLEMLVEWLLELYIISTLMFSKVNKRSGFLIKFIVGIIVILAISYPVAILYSVVGDTVLGRTLIYFFLFFLAIIHHSVCYETTAMKGILFCDIAYLTQNTVYKLFLLLNQTLTITGVIQPGIPGILYKAIYYSTIGGLICASYFIYIRSMRKQLLELQFSPFLIYVTLGTIVITNLLCSVFDIHVDQIASALIPGEAQLSFYLVNITGDLFAILSNVIIIIVFFDYYKRMTLVDDINKMKYVLEQSEEQYKISQETIESINIKCHDMRHKINKIVGDSLSKETINEINESIEVYDSIIESGNKTLDIILMEKSLLCETDNIAFTKLVDGKAVNFLSTGDAFCLFGNILDNAIEASKNIKDKSKRYINLSVRQIGNGIAEIECFNYYEGTIKFVNGLPETIKDDKGNHGFGVKSIRQIIKKYNGNMTVDASNNIYRLHFVLYQD